MDTIQLFTLPLFLISLVCISKILTRNTSRKPKPPEAGGAWPIIGHLHLLGGSQPIHISLANMADKYGPIFTIKLGVRRALVVSDSETVKECLTTNDKAFATRPNLTASVLMGYNNSMFGFAPHGPYWRQMRKFVTLELLSNSRLDMLKHARESEIKLSMQELYQQWDKSKNIGSDNLSVEMKRWFWDLTLNVILRMIIGKRIPSFGKDAENRVLKMALRDFTELSGKFVVSDALPFLRWLDIGGDEKAMKKIGEDLDRYAEGWLDEHRRRKSSDQFKDGEDFMDVMLSKLKDEADRAADITNKATCLALVLAAEDTTAVTLTWILSLLLNNRDALNKLRNELDIHVGNNRLVEETDMKNLVYLQAVIKETMRLYPAAPISLIHEAAEDCTVSGYHVPAGTWLITNLYKLQHDPRTWSDPDEFRPERFLTSHKHVDFRGQILSLYRLAAEEECALGFICTPSFAAYGC
ncbi:putative Cytochrome P450 [Hibiscus syriacus]|uniref:Cytochrome P450 n=1 Tax=Hibiscus syriacus TaxID=106335 RepID=A0A6A2XIF3_HIBSY|nr:putative Cytochrome P450 [Hibiscus syriacus]